MGIVLWARHGENVANLTRTLSYQVYDRELTDKGREQARSLGESLAGLALGSMTRLFCSPLRRARQTAEIVGQQLGVAILAELEDLRELNVGELDGRSDEGAWNIYAHVLASWSAGQRDVRFPGGENCVELEARLARALERVTEPGGASRSVVVAHGAGLRAALPGLCAAPDPGVDIPTAQFAVLETRRDQDAIRVGVVSWPTA